MAVPGNFFSFMPPVPPDPLRGPIPDLFEHAQSQIPAESQVQGYGTRIMNQIKEECKRTGIEGMLTYADNHAVGDFRKQGFKKNVIMKRERWQGKCKLLRRGRSRT